MTWTKAEAKKFGFTVRALRQERDLSQERLAFTAGLTKNQLQLIEAGRNSGRRDSDGPSNPRVSTLAGLAEVLGLSISELLAKAEL